jgi:hypothetical protein
MSSKCITIIPDYNSMLEKAFILSKWMLKIVVTKAVGGGGYVRNG